MEWLPQLMSALIAIESGGDNSKVGDAGEVGILQIREICVRDVNRIYGTKYAWPEAALDEATAMEICRKYLTYYGARVKNCTPEQAARIWNGGPRGWRLKATRGYWKKVYLCLSEGRARRARLGEAIGRSLAATAS